MRKETYITAKRDSRTDFAIQDSFMVGAKPLRNEGEVNPTWESSGFEWGYSGQGPRCLAYSALVAYYKSRRMLARWERASEAMWAWPLCELFHSHIADGCRSSLRVSFSDIRQALEAAGLPA